MTGGGDASPVVTHISSLGEDLVLEIFLRLSSLGTLVRAALTCRAWRRAVASSPDFRRRFRALHPAPPLLGIFFDRIDNNTLFQPPCGPSFVPAGFRHWDLAGAVGGGDFLLSSLLERSTKSSYPYWHILDCCGGRVLLSDMNDDADRPLIVLNPLIRRSALEFRCPSPDQYQTDPRLICLDEDSPSSFRVALLAYGGCMLQPYVFSSDTGAWSDRPAVDFPARLADGTSGEASETICIEYQWKLRANGFVYWSYVRRNETRHGIIDMDLRYLISLDTTTMEISFAKLPQCLRRSNDLDLTFRAGEAEDGAACIVYSDGSNIGVVKHTRGDDGVDRWVPDRVLCFGVVKCRWGSNGFDKWVPDDRVFPVELDAELTRANLGERFFTELSVLAVRDGYMYFATKRCFITSLCLATMKVEKVFHRRMKEYYEDAFAYIMPWPPCC